MRTAGVILLGIIGLNVLEALTSRTFTLGFNCGALVAALVFLWDAGGKHPDSDRSRDGGDAASGSVHESAGLQGIGHDQ